MARPRGESVFGKIASAFIRTASSNDGTMLCLVKTDSAPGWPQVFFSVNQTTCEDFVDWSTVVESTESHASITAVQVT